MSTLLSDDEIERYLARLGVPPTSLTIDLAGLTLLQRAHLAHAPFENLDIVYAGGVLHDQRLALHKIVERRRGGWCFELNGAFALLLQSLGFDVLLLGAAVLLDGPSTVLEHLALEVSGGDARIEPHLVDVGFGDSFDDPLALNERGGQAGRSGTFEFIASPLGTTLAEHVDGVPEARLRFKRVGHSFSDFAPVAASMQSDPNKHWSKQPFATRLLDTDSSDRVTLTHDRLKIRRSGEVTERDVPGEEWPGLLDDWFAMEIPGADGA